jgi:hypothetical protein
VTVHDLPYTVGFERFNHHTDDGRVEPITVRVTERPQQRREPPPCLVGVRHDSAVRFHAWTSSSDVVAARIVENQH